MTDTVAAMKMMEDGFALLAKGFAEIIATVNERQDKTLRSNKEAEDDDTRTCDLVEAGKRLGYSRPTVNRLCKAGKLQYIKDPQSGYRRVVVKSITAYYNRYLQAA